MRKGFGSPSEGRELAPESLDVGQFLCLVSCVLCLSIGHTGRRSIPEPLLMKLMDQCKYEECKYEEMQGDCEDSSTRD